MRRWMVAGLSVALVACTEEPPEAAASGPDAVIESANPSRIAEQRYLRATAQAIAARDTPRDLAFAALLQQAAALPAPVRPGDVVDATAAVPTDSFDATAQAWRRRAAEGAGDDVIAHVLLTSGPARPDAVTFAAAARWAELQPDNGAPWLMRLDLPVQARLDAVAARPAFTSGAYPALRWMVDTLTQFPPPANLTGAPQRTGEDARDHALSIAAMLVFSGVPTFKEILDACPRGDRDTAPRCRAAADRLTQADTLLVRRLGDALLRRLPEPPADALASRERAHAWQQQALDGVVERIGEGRQTALILDPAIADEIAMRARMFEEAGVSLEPPPDWIVPSRSPVPGPPHAMLDVPSIGPDRCASATSCSPVP